MQQVVGVLGVVVGELVRPERAEDPLADDRLDLGRGHPAVQRVGDDQLDVVDAGLGGAREDGLDDPLADVGQAHRRQRQADVVEGDRQLHAGAQEGAAAASSRSDVEQRLDGSPGRRREAGQGLGRVDHPGAEREPLEAEGSRRSARAAAGCVRRPRARSPGGSRACHFRCWWAGRRRRVRGAQPACDERVVEGLAPAVQRVAHRRPARRAVRVAASSGRDLEGVAGGWRRRRPATARGTTRA